MMRGSVVFLAVFVVSSYSIGVNGAHFVKSGIRGYGTGRGNEDTPGIGESSLGNLENDGRGHYIGKRSLLGLNLVGNLGHDIARLAAFRSAAARRQQIIDPNAEFPSPILPPPFLDVTSPSLKPQISTKPWNHQTVVKSYDLPLKQAMPSVFGGELQPLPTLKFLPLSEMKDKVRNIISSLLPASHMRTGIFMQPFAGSSFARSQDFYRSDLKNRRSRYSDFRSYSSPLRSYQTLPSLPSDGIYIPLNMNVRNTAPARLRTEVNFPGDTRSAVIDYLVQLWNKICKWVKPGSSSGEGMGDFPPEGLVPEGEIPIGGQVLVAGLPPEDHYHTEQPPEQDDVIIEQAPPLQDDDDVQIINLSPEKDDLGTPVIPEGLLGATSQHSTGEGESNVDEDYHKPIQYKPWRPKPHYASNWETHSAEGMKNGWEEAASMIEDTSAVG